MGLTGFGLVGFIIIHMLGNLQIFLGPDTLNAYAKLLHASKEVLWAFRIALISMIGLHIWAAISLARENRKARPQRYAAEGTVQASYASRTMIWSGIIIVSFAVYHILHFTVRVTHPEYQEMTTELNGQATHDVFQMVVAGFQNPWIAGFYVLSVGLLCFHMSHGVSSMFQSLGLMNRNTAPALKTAAVLISMGIFVGMAAVPISILSGLITQDYTGIGH
jgi:succinate dehydrogenase / fumarate reductase cytochrome b subunit